MSWLFAIGVAVGMADDNDGTAGLAGLVSWLMITNLLATGTVATLTGVGADAVNPAFAKIGNQFIGILAGLIGSTCYLSLIHIYIPYKKRRIINHEIYC